MVSWDHIAAPNSRIARPQPSATRLAVTCRPRRSARVAGAGGVVAKRGAAHASRRAGGRRRRRARRPGSGRPRAGAPRCRTPAVRRTRRRSGPASPGVPAQQALGPAGRVALGRGRRRGRAVPCPAAEPAQADVGDPALRVQVRLERRRAGGREPVGPPAVVGFERLDHALRLKPGERLVERARGQPDPGEGLDVLGQRVPVLGPVGQAGQDQRGRPVPPNPASAEPSASSLASRFAMRTTIHRDPIHRKPI